MMVKLDYGGVVWCERRREEEQGFLMQRSTLNKIIRWL
jgi:hypothetical protein